MVVYVDEIFIINTATDALLMYGVCTVAGYRPKHRRIALAAVFGGVYAAIEAAFALSHMLRSAMLLFMSAIAFGPANLLMNFWKCFAVIIFTDGLLGIGMSISGADVRIVKGTVNIFAPPLTTALMCLGSYPLLLFAGHIISYRRRLYRARVEYNDRAVRIILLRDSGNLLRFRNKPVAVVDWASISSLFCNDSFKSYRENADMHIAYGGIGGGGSAPIFKPDKFIVEGKVCDMTIAVIEYDFGKMYCGVIGEI